MEASKPELPPNQQAFLDRFIATCQQHGDILAAFLGGSYARGTADGYSDLDLYVIVSDEAFNDFSLRRDEFLHLLGEPVFIEDFDIPNMVFYVFEDGIEGELGMGREGEYSAIHGGPHIVLVDKKDLLAGVEFAPGEPDAAEQAEKLRRLIFWFWHELSHFITAMQRGQLWWAQGQLEVLRGYCVNLLRMRNDFSDPEVGDEPYFKIDKALPARQLSALKDTFCPPEKGAMLKSGIRIVHLYQELAIPLSQAHDIAFPGALEHLMLHRLADLQKSTSL